MEQEQVIDQEKAKAFFENFIQNCETSPRLDSVQTAYFCNWAKLIIGRQITPIPATESIGVIHFNTQESTKQLNDNDI